MLSSQLHCHLDHWRTRIRSAKLLASMDGEERRTVSIARLRRTYVWIQALLNTVIQIPFIRLVWHWSACNIFWWRFRNITKWSFFTGSNELSPILQFVDLTLDSLDVCSKIYGKRPKTQYCCDGSRKSVCNVSCFYFWFIYFLLSLITYPFKHERIFLSSIFPGWQWWCSEHRRRSEPRLPGYRQLRDILWLHSRFSHGLHRCTPLRWLGFQQDWHSH